MDVFSYYNIFDTKGMEYIVIIAFLLLLIPFWLVLNKTDMIRQQIRRAIGVLTPGALKIPQGIFYSKHHTWAYLEKSGTAKIGLDDLLLHITGDVQVSYRKEAGETVNKGDLVAEIVQEGNTLSVFSPISGKIIAPNAALEQNHEYLSDDPYGMGWMFKITPSKWKEEIASCYLAGEATEWLRSEIERYKTFVALNMNRYPAEGVHPVLQDGGELSDNSLSGMPPEMWRSFQQEFLQPVH